MKNTILAILFMLSTLTCFGQSMFFDNINGSTWTSSREISGLTLHAYKKIPLTKLIHSKDSIKEDVTIWTFRDSVLTIIKYYFQQKTDTLVGNYLYTINNDKGVLQIILQNETVLSYKAGIVSTGYYCLLLRIKDRKDKNKK